MALHLLWGCVLWFSISKYGLGVSTDAVQLLFGGLNLSQGHGLISYDGSFLILWPPLYPVLLAAVHLATGLSMLASAGVLQAAAFVGLSVCLSLIFLRIFPDNFPLALAANVLCDVGVVVLIGFDEVGSDYLHLFLVMLCVLLIGIYTESRSPRAFVALAAVGMLAMLDRYLGIAAVATAAAAALMATGASLGRKLQRGFFLTLSAVPALFWLAVTSQMYDRRSPISFAENFTWFSKSILEWFFPTKAVRVHLNFNIALLWAVVIALVALVAFGWRRYRQDSAAGPRAFMRPMFLYGAFYALALFGSASVAYSNKLGGRFLLPLYIPLVTLFLVALGFFLRSVKEQRGPVRLAVSAACFCGLLLLGGRLLQFSMPIVFQSHQEGAVGGENAFNTAAWNGNQALQYWRRHTPRGVYLLLSNEPDGVAFLTQHAAGSSPRKTSGPYGTENYPLDSYVSDLFSAGSDVYLVWIEPGAKYFYSAADMASIARVQPLFIGKDGGVYRLLPKAGT